MRLAPVFLGSLARRRMATLFSLVAIVLGVALGMAVQAVNEAALGEFGRGLRTLAGDAELQVLGPRGGFDENLYAVLAGRPEVAAASPVVELEVRLAGSEEQKVALRNVRRDANKHADGLKNHPAKHFAEDDIETLKEEIQELVKKFETKVDQMVEAKTKELNTI